MKKTRILKRSQKFALGIALALGCNVMAMGIMGNAEAAEYTAPITGNFTTDTVYSDAGMTSTGSVDSYSHNIYTFNEDSAVINVADTAITSSGSNNRLYISANELTLNAAIGISTATQPLTVEVDKLNINVASETAPVYGVLRLDEDGRTLATKVTADETNITLDGSNGGAGVAILQPGSKNASRLTIDMNGALNITSKTANQNAADFLGNTAGVLVDHANSAAVNLNGDTNIDVVGNGLVASQSGGSINVKNNAKISVAKGTEDNSYYSVVAANGGVVNANTTKVSGLNAYGGYVSNGRTMQLDGDIYIGASSTANLAVDGREGYLKGVINNSGNLELILGTGASWYNTATNVSEKDTVSHINTLSGCNGTIYQLADSNDITVGKYGNALGTYLNVHYTHDDSDPTKILGGNITINNASVDSEIYLVTDYDANMNSAEVQNDVLDALANKLFYNAYVTGERNLTAVAQIAEGLTTASVTKYYADVNFDETTGQGYVQDGVVNAPVSLEQVTTEFNSGLRGNKALNEAFVNEGIYKGNALYSFTKDTKINQTKYDGAVAGPWLGTYTSAISSAYGEEQITIDMNGNDLSVHSQESGSVVGIAGVGSGKVTIVNPGKIDVYAQGTGQTAALFVNGGGQLHIQNGGDNLEDKVVTLRGFTTSSGSGAVVKSMNGNGSVGRSWLKVDGLVDVYANVTSGQGAGEALSAVASTIEVGGGKIFAVHDGTGDSNFGGSNSQAIRAYGEFVSPNYGIVNVNVLKKADTADADAIGAGNNTTQIVGDFSTVGGMGTKGTINVGLNTADSYWYGDYSAGSGWGVTPGDYGCLNLWMGNGADWQGYTRYATNLYMDSGATWEGYVYNNTNNLIMDIKNGAVWTPTTKGTASLENTQVKIFRGATGDDKTGYVYMSDSDGMNVIANDYSGKVTLQYDHVAVLPTQVLGGNFTVVNAAEGSEITLVTDADGIDINNNKLTDRVLNALASKLFYTGAVNGETNLTAYVQIAEGLTSASVLKQATITKFDAETGAAGDSTTNDAVFENTITGVPSADGFNDGIVKDDVYTFEGNDTTTLGGINITDAPNNVTVDMDYSNLVINDGGISADGSDVSIVNAATINVINNDAASDAVIKADGANVTIDNFAGANSEYRKLDAAYGEVGAEGGTLVKAANGGNIIITGMANLTVEKDKGVMAGILAEGGKVELGGGTIEAVGGMEGDNNVIYAMGGGEVKVGHGKDIATNITGDIAVDNNSRADIKLHGPNSRWRGAFVNPVSFFRMRSLDVADNNVTLDNGSVWEATSSVAQTLQSLRGGSTADAAGILNMVDNSGDITIENYSGNTVVWYDQVALGDFGDSGNITINKAEEGSAITLMTDNTGITVLNGLYKRSDVVEAMQALANKLYYTEAVDGVTNLNGFVQVAEGLTTASKTIALGEMTFDKANGGQGQIGNNVELDPDPQDKYPTAPDSNTYMYHGVSGDIDKDFFYVTHGNVQMANPGVYNFNANMRLYANQGNYMATDDIYSGIYSTSKENDVTLNMNEHSIEVYTRKYIQGDFSDAYFYAADGGNVTINDVSAITFYGTSASTGNQSTKDIYGFYADNEGKINVNNTGSITIDNQYDLISNGGVGAVIKAANNSEINIAGNVNLTAYAARGIENVIDVSNGSEVTIGGGVLKVNGEANVATLSGGSTLNINSANTIEGSIVTVAPEVMTFTATEPVNNVVNITMAENGTWEGNFGGAGGELNLALNEGSKVTLGSMDGALTVIKDINNTTATVDITAATDGSTLTALSYAEGINFFDDAEVKDALAKAADGINGMDETTVGLADKVAADATAVYSVTAGDDGTIDDNDINEALSNMTLGADSEVIFDRTENTTKAKLHSDGGTIKMAKDSADLTIGEYSGSTTVFYTNEAVYEPDRIYGGNITIGKAAAESQVHLVTDGSNVNRQDAEQIRTTLENLADKITYEANDGNLSGSVTLAEGLTASSAQLMFADLGFDANGQGDVSGEITINKETAPGVVYGDSETAMMSGAKSAMASTAMMWRSESNDLLKRMGDLRENKAERGIWAKYYGGKYEMDGDKTGFNTSYNAYQVGYDKQVGNGWNVGVAMSYSDGDSTYTRGKGETSVMSLGLYGTWNGDDGQYVDLIVKRSKLDNEFEVSNIYGKKLDGDYEAWGTSISAEYGKRFELKNGMYVDPNVELTLGRVEGESYNAQSTYLDALGKNKSLHVQQDDFNSLVGRLGVRFGHNTENNSIHAKVALAHEFCGDFDSRFSAEGEVPGSTSVDFGDTWYEIQLGGSTKLSDNSLLYATFERSFGGDVEQKWRVDAGLRWSF